MTFLKKLGQIMLEATQIFMGIAPIVQASQPGSAGTIQVISQDLAAIGNVIIQAEAMGQALQLPGAQKLQAAVGPVSQIILQSSIMAGHQIDNTDLFKTGAQKIADGMADVLNSLKANVPTTNMT